jgi:hypothetical protein
LECNYGGYCDIDVNNRRTCASCRLTKCFANGMHIEMIRSSSTKKKNRITRKRKIDLILPTSTVSAKLNEKQPEQVRFFTYGIFSLYPSLANFPRPTLSKSQQHLITKSSLIFFSLIYVVPVWKLYFLSSSVKNKSSKESWINYFFQKNLYIRDRY